MWNYIDVPFSLKKNHKEKKCKEVYVHERNLTYKVYYPLLSIIKDCVLELFHHVNMLLNL